MRFLNRILGEYVEHLEQQMPTLRSALHDEQQKVEMLQHDPAADVIVFLVQEQTDRAARHASCS